MCSRRFTPLARQAETTACGSSTCTRAKSGPYRSAALAAPQAVQHAARLITASCPRQLRQHAGRVDVGLDDVDRGQRRCRCLARSRRRVGTVTLTARRASAAARWRPTKPAAAENQDPQGNSSSTGSAALRGGMVPRRALMRRELLLQHRRVEARRSPSPSSRSRASRRRESSRRRSRPRASARRSRQRRARAGPGVVGGRREHRVAELVEHHLQVAGAERRRWSRRR